MTPDTATSIEVPQEHWRLVDDLNRIAAQIAELGERRAVVVDRLQQLLEEHDAEVGLIDGRPVVRWTHVTTTRLNQRDLREAHPDLYEQYQSTSTHRRFTLVAGETR